MLRKLIIAALALVLSAAHGAAGAAAQVVCTDRLRLLADLEKTYGEVRQAMAITDAGGLLEVTVAPSGSWTILITVPGGVACIVATGQDWQSLTAPGETASDIVDRPGA